jgi:hypothetical protein
MNSRRAFISFLAAPYIWGPGAYGQPGVEARNLREITRASIIRPA